jgi:hypothetical protein
MRNAGLTLGIIGGIIGMIVGFFSFGFTEFLSWAELDYEIENAGLIRTMSLVSPLLAIAGGAMARSQAQIGGVLMLISAAGMYWAFGFGVFTMFPIAFCALGGLLSVLAVKPDSA